MQNKQKALEMEPHKAFELSPEAEKVKECIENVAKAVKELEVLKEIPEEFCCFFVKTYLFIYIYIYFKEAFNNSTKTVKKKGQLIILF